MKVYAIVSSSVAVALSCLPAVCRAGEATVAETIEPCAYQVAPVYPDADRCRALIAEAIAQYADVLTPDLRAQLTANLGRSISFGERVATYPPSAIDLAVGWDVIAVEAGFKAECECTVRGVRQEEVRQALVEIWFDDTDDGTQLFTARIAVSIRAQGKLISISDLDALNQLPRVPMDQTYTKTNQACEPTE